MAIGVEPDDFSDTIVDLTDVLEHFRSRVRVTGIQRVVMQLAEPLFARGARPCRFEARTGTWSTLDAGRVRALFALSRHAAREDPAWRDAVAAAGGAADGPGLPAGGILLSLGANWSSDKLFPAVRQVRRSSGLRFAALIHDAVPILYPELCDLETIGPYRRWFASCLENADAVITTSRSNADDIGAACASLGLRPRDVVLCPLHGGPELRARRPAPGASRVEVLDVLSGPFVLFVGTLEPRKDHRFVIDGWRRLLAQAGPGRTPKLVLVGALGWGYERVLAAIADPTLSDAVVHLGDVSDEELDRLYAGCRFSIYHSLHEGWGLPVTESLARGKVPLVPRHSGLAESGAGGALFYDGRSPTDFLAKCARLAADDAYLAELEERAARSRPAGAWSDIGCDLIATLRQRFPAAGDAGRRPVARGTIYRFTSAADGRALPAYALAEALRLSGWHAMERWGMWSSALQCTLAGPLDPAFFPAGEGEEPVVAFLVMKAQFRRFSLSFFSHSRRCREDVEVGEGRCCVQVPLSVDGGAFELTIRQDALVDLREAGVEGDLRSIGVGIESVMVCRASDLLARMRLLEHVSGYRSAGL